jgi:hypothetical protein
MMGISMGGLIGAILGTLVAAVNYHLFVGVIEKLIRERRQLTPGAQDNSEFSLSTIRRFLLIADLVVFAGVGYLLGDMLAA